MVKAEILGLGALRSNLRALREYFSNEAQQVSHDELISVANNMAAMMRQLAPVLTGNLVSLIQVLDGGDSITILSAAPYSIFVEFGTIKMKAQPFFRPAYEEYGVFTSLTERHRAEIEARLQSV